MSEARKLTAAEARAMGAAAGTPSPRRPGARTREEREAFARDRAARAAAYAEHMRTLPTPAVLTEVIGELVEEREIARVATSRGAFVASLPVYEHLRPYVRCRWEKVDPATGEVSGRRNKALAVALEDVDAVASCMAEVARAVAPLREALERDGAK